MERKVSPPTINIEEAHDIITDMARAVMDGKFGSDFITLNIVGPAGVGKTAICSQVAHEIDESLGNQKTFGVLVLPVGEWQEAGDMIGMPDRRDNVTVFLPPQFTEEFAKYDGGILVLDDITRANRYIMQAVMQLLQFGRTISWELPRGWMIVCTSNPSWGEERYHVADMDIAQATRMIWFEIAFDAEVWCKYAAQRGHHQVIRDAVRHNPNMVGQGLCTARTLDKLGTVIKGMDIRIDPGLSKNELTLLRRFISAHIGTEGASIIDGVLNIGVLPTAEAILSNPEIVKKWKKRPDALTLIAGRIADWIVGVTSADIKKDGKDVQIKVSRKKWLSRDVFCTNLANLMDILQVESTSSIFARMSEKEYLYKIVVSHDKIFDRASSITKRIQTLTKEDDAK